MKNVKRMCTVVTFVSLIIVTIAPVISVFAAEKIAWERRDKLVKQIAIDPSNAVNVLSEILTPEQATQFENRIVVMTNADYLSELLTAKNALSQYGAGNAEMETYLQRLDVEIAQLQSLIDAETAETVE